MVNGSFLLEKGADQPHDQRSIFLCCPKVIQVAQDMGLQRSTELDRASFQGRAKLEDGELGG